MALEDEAPLPTWLSTLSPVGSPQTPRSDYNDAASAPMQPGAEVGGGGGDLWGALLQGLLPPRPPPTAEDNETALRTAALERAATVVQRFTRGRIVRLDAKEINRRFRLLEIYARVEERAAIIIQRFALWRMAQRRERAATRVQAIARGWLVRLHPRARPLPVSGAYKGPSAARLNLEELRGAIFKRSRGWPRYQKRYMYVALDDAGGAAALCHRAGDADGVGGGVEKRLPLASITAVHVESWGRYVFSVESSGPQRTTRFRCSTHEELVLWSNGLSLAVPPPAVEGLEHGRPTSPV